MELESKDLKIEQLNSQLKSSQTSSTPVNNIDHEISGIKYISQLFHSRLYEMTATDVEQSELYVSVHYIFSFSFFSANMPREGWLSIPNKQNIKKYGWKKQASHS